MQKKYYILLFFCIFLLILVGFFTKKYTKEFQKEDIIITQNLSLLSTTQKEEGILKKTGYALQCGSKVFYPFHLDGEEVVLSKNEETVEFEKEKIDSQSDMVQGSIQGSVVKNTFSKKEFIKDAPLFLSPGSTTEPFDIQRVFTSVELNEKKLTGNFFSIEYPFKKGDSGRGIFDRRGNCVGMLIGFLEGSGEGIFVEVE